MPHPSMPRRTSSLVRPFAGARKCDFVGRRRAAGWALWRIGVAVRAILTQASYLGAALLLAACGDAGIAAPWGFG
ncbi:MAG: hypothetical protein AAGG01_21000, partial [Planctomycetota bacterium]